MKELQINRKKNLLLLLQILISKERQIDYKESVPFVHVPIELIEQLNSIFLPKHKWFREIFNDMEWEALVIFNDRASKLIDMLPQEIPDVPEIFKNKNWIELMAEANILIEIIHPSTSLPSNRNSG